MLVRPKSHGDFGLTNHGQERVAIQIQWNRKTWCCWWNLKEIFRISSGLGKFSLLASSGLHLIDPHTNGRKSALLKIHPFKCKCLSQISGQSCPAKLIYKINYHRNENWGVLASRWVTMEALLVGCIAQRERTKEEPWGASLFNDKVEEIAGRWQEMRKTLGWVLRDQPIKESHVKVAGPPRSKMGSVSHQVSYSTRERQSSSGIQEAYCQPESWPQVPGQNCCWIRLVLGMW